MPFPVFLSECLQCCLYRIITDDQRTIILEYTVLPRKQEGFGRKLLETKAERHTFKSRDPSKNERIVRPRF